MAMGEGLPSLAEEIANGEPPESGLGSHSVARIEL